MKHRSPAAVFFLSIITLGIYAWYWCVKTKGEMNRLGNNIPTAWIWLIPFVGSLWWTWKYSEGVEKVTNNKLSQVLAFVLLAVLGLIGMAIVQNEFNQLATAAAPGLPPQPVAPQAAGMPQPDNSFGGPVAATPPVTPAEPVAPTQPEAPQPPVNPTPPAPAA
jgi:hypothetical protein